MYVSFRCGVLRQLGKAISIFLDRTLMTNTWIDGLRASAHPIALITSAYLLIVTRYAKTFFTYLLGIA